MSTRRPTSGPGWRKHGAILALYTLLSLVLTWPLARHLTTHVTGDGIDDPSLAWNLWWLNERLVSQQNPNIFDVDWMFFPIRINLAFYTLTPLNGLLSVPIQNGLSLILANNLLLLSSFVLGAYGTYLLTRDLLRRRKSDRTRMVRMERKKQDLAEKIRVNPPNPKNPRSIALFSSEDWAALIAGIVFAFASSKLFYASLGQFNIASSHWIPFCVLYVTRIYPAQSFRQGMRAGAMAGLFLLFQAWAELTYATFLFIFIALYFVYTLVCWQMDRRQIGHRRDDGRSASSWTRPAGARPVPLHRWRGTRSFRQDAEQGEVESLRHEVEMPIDRPGFWTLLGRYVILAAVTVVGLLPFLLAMIPDMLAEGDFFTSGGGFADVFSADLLGYLVPTRLHPIFGEWVAQLPFPNDKGQHLFIGYAAVLVAIVGVVGLIRGQVRRLRLEGWFWLVTTLFFWWMTLGAEVRWAGQSTGIPGPFALISQLPFFSGNRYPSRYSVMLMLCIAVLVAYGLIWIFEWLQRRSTTGQSIARLAVPIAAAMVGVIFVFEHLAAPLPLNDFRVPPIYERLAELPEDATVLELPTGWRNGARVLGRSDVLIMMQQWYQTEHGLRRLGGNTSRNPAYKFQYFSEAPLIGDLIALMNADREHISRAVDAEWAAIVERNRPLAGEVLDTLDISHVLVYVDHAPEELQRFIDEALPLNMVEEWQGDDWLGRPSTIRLYAVQPINEQPAAWEVDLAGEMGNLYLAEGWSTLPVDGKRYALRSRADLMLDLPDEGGQLSLQLTPETALAGVAVNGTNLAMGGAEPGWVYVPIPAGVGDAAVDRLTLRFDGEPTPTTELLAAPDQSGWPIGETGVFLPSNAAVLARSAGEETGNFAKSYVNGEDVAINSRGYNLVALTQDGDLLDSTVFDTFASEDEANAMAAWISQWPAGTIIAGAVRDEASMKLNQAGVDALRSLGVATDLRGQFRQSHAFVGVAGAGPGTALEASGVLRPSNVAVGPPVDGAEVYGGIGRIRFESE